MLYSIYIENTENFDLKEALEIALKKYNNLIHTSTKYKPNYIFYSNSNELFSLVLKNIKNSFKSVGIYFKYFEFNEKCFLNGKFKIKIYCKGNIPGVLEINRLKYKKIYSKINVIVKENSNVNYIISIADDYI